MTCDKLIGERVYYQRDSIGRFSCMVVAFGSCRKRDGFGPSLAVPTIPAVTIKRHNAASVLRRWRSQ